LAVSTWSWIGVAFGIALAIYVALVLTLLIVGRRTDARAWAGFVPDCAILFTRLVKDPGVPRRHKILLALLVGYLSMPFDLIPDFIPVVGVLDDAIIVAVVLRALFRGAGPEVVREHWPGPQPSLDLKAAARSYSAVRPSSNASGSGPTISEGSTSGTGRSSSPSRKNMAAATAATTREAARPRAIAAFTSRLTSSSRH
jgi:uncharacterized membrane protein YkvA (DUF1232 family)